MEETEKFNVEPIPKGDDSPSSQGKTCALCGCSTPAVRCDRCSSQTFCLSCDDMYHKHPKRRLHLRKAVDSIWNSSRSPRLRRRTDLPGDPSKIPIPPPRTKKRERHSIGGRIFLKSGLELGSFGHSKVFDMKSITPPIPSKDFFAGQKSHAAEMENGIDRQAQLLNRPESAQIYENDSAINQENVTNSSEMDRSPWNTPRPNMASPIQVSIPSSSPDIMTNGQSFGFPSKPHSQSAADLTGSSATHPIGHHPYPFPHPYPYMHPPMHAPYSHSMAHMNCAQCISSSWSNLMSPHPSPFFHPMPWGSAQSTMLRNQQGGNGHLKHSHGDLITYPDSNFQYPYPGGTFYPNGPPVVDPNFMKDLHQQVEANRTKKSPAGSRHSNEDVATEAAASKTANLDAANEPTPSTGAQEPQITEEEPPKPQKPTEPWSCLHCTFINPPGIYICQVCCKTSYGNNQKPPDDQEDVAMDTRDIESPLINRDAFLNSPRFSPEAQKDDELQDSNIDAEDSEAEEQSIPPADSPDVIKLTTETQTSTTTKSTDVQTHNLVCKSIASSTDSIFPKQEISVQTELAMLTQNCSVATDPMISSQSMESLLSGVSAPPYHNRRAGWGRGATSFSTQSLYERGRSRSPMPRSASVMNEAHMFGRESSFPPEEMMPNWSQAWLLSDPMYYKPHNPQGLGQAVSKETDFDGTWGSMDRLNKRVQLKQEQSKHESYRKPQFHRSLDDLKADKRQEVHHSQELMLLQTVKEAERCGFSLEDLHVAYLHCGNQNPVYWLEDNWTSMVKNVIALAAKYGEDNEENDVGIITTSEAKEALHIHRGDIWDAVTECIENRQRKILELTVRGNFTQKQISEALKNNEGNVELAYADLVRASSKRHKFILSPGLSEDSEDLNLYNPIEDSGLDSTIPSSVLRAGKHDGLTESKTEKKKSDFLTKLSAIRNAQSERRKAREEKELFRESITQELPILDKSEDSILKTEDEGSLKILKENIKLVHQESAEDSVSIDATNVLQVDADLPAELEPDIELKDKSKNEDNVRVDYDTNWVDSQGEWIEEYSDEQWDEEGDGQWVTLEKKYEKLETEIQKEAMQMAALWEKEELEDDVFEEEKETSAAPTEQENLRLSQDEKFEQWVKVNLEKSFSEPEDELIKEQELDVEAMAETLLKDSIEYDDIPASSPLQHYPTAFDLTDKSQLEADWVNMPVDTDRLVQDSAMEVTDECLEFANDDIALQKRLSDEEYSDGEWEKIDVDEQLKEFSDDNITLDRKESPAEQSLEISAEQYSKLDESESADKNLTRSTEEAFITDASAVSLHDYVEILPSEDKGTKLTYEPDVISPNISESMHLSPEKEIVAPPFEQQPIEVSFGSDDQPKPPVRRKSKLNSAAIEQALKIHSAADNSSLLDKPPALPAKTKSKERSPESFNVFGTSQKADMEGKTEELSVNLSAVIPRNVSPSEAPEKPPRLSPSAIYSNGKSNENLNLRSSKDASPATSMGEESDSNCFADSDSDPEIKAIRQKYMHKKLTKYENEIDDMQEEINQIHKPADVIDSAEISKLSSVAEPTPINIELTIPTEDLSFSPELPIPLGVRGSRVAPTEDIEVPKAFREDTTRPLQLFKATKREITRSASYEVPTSVSSEKFQRNRSFEMDIAGESSHGKQGFPEQQVIKPFLTPTSDMVKELQKQKAVEVPPELVYPSITTESSVYLNQFNDTYYNDSVPKQTISIEQLQEGLQIAEAQLDSSIPMQKAILSDIQEEKQLPEDFAPKSAQEKEEEMLSPETGILSAAADYFFGRYDEITVARPKKKAPVIRGGKVSAPASKGMSTSVTQTASSPTQVPPRMEQSAVIVTAEKSVTDASNVGVQNNVVVSESLVKPNASMDMKESVLKSPGVETAVASAPQVVPKEPVTAEYLSFAEDYFFGSYNEVVIPKKGKKKTNTLQKSKIPGSPQLSRVQSLPEQVVSAAPVSPLASSEGTSLQLATDVLNSVQLDATSTDPIFYPAQVDQNNTSEVFYEFYDANEHIPEQFSQPIADDPSLDSSASKSNSKVKVVHFEEPQPPVVPPPRKNRAQGDKTQSTNISAEHSSAGEYLFGQYDHSLQDKKKLPFHSEDFKMISGFVPPDFPSETLPQPDGIEDNMQSSDINVIPSEESIKCQEKIENTANLKKIGFGECSVAHGYEVVDMQHNNTLSQYEMKEDGFVTNTESFFSSQEIHDLDKKGLQTDEKHDDQISGKGEQSVTKFGEAEKSDHELQYIDQEKILSYEDFKDDLVLAIEKEYELQQNNIMGDVQNELSEASALFQIREDFGDPFGDAFGNELKFKSQKNNIEQDHTDDSEQEWKLNEERKNCVNAAHLERAVSNKSALDLHDYETENKEDAAGFDSSVTDTMHFVESQSQGDVESEIGSESGLSKTADEKKSDQYSLTLDVSGNQNVEALSAKDIKGACSSDKFEEMSDLTRGSIEDTEESKETTASLISAISDDVIGEEIIEERSSTNEEETDSEKEILPKPLSEEHANRILKSESIAINPHESETDEGSFPSQNIIYPLRVLCEMVANNSEYISLDQISKSIRPYSVVEGEIEADLLNSSVEDNESVMSKALQMLSDVDNDISKEDSDDSLIMSTHSSVSTQIAVSSDVQIKDLEMDDSVANLEVKEKDKSDQDISDALTDTREVLVKTQESVDIMKLDEETTPISVAETDLPFEPLYISNYFESRKGDESSLEIQECVDSQDLNEELPVDSSKIEENNSPKLRETFNNTEAEANSEEVTAEEENCLSIMSHFYDEWFENIQPSNTRAGILSSYATYSYTESSASSNESDKDDDVQEVDVVISDDKKLSETLVENACHDRVYDNSQSVGDNNKVVYDFENDSPEKCANEDIFLSVHTILDEDVSKIVASNVHSELSTSASEQNALTAESTPVAEKFSTSKSCQTEDSFEEDVFFDSFDDTFTIPSFINLSIKNLSLEEPEKSEIGVQCDLIPTELNVVIEKGTSQLADSVTVVTINETLKNLQSDTVVCSIEPSVDTLKETLSKSDECGTKDESSCESFEDSDSDLFIESHSSLDELDPDKTIKKSNHLYAEFDSDTGFSSGSDSGQVKLITKKKKQLEKSNLDIVSEKSEIAVVLTKECENVDGKPLKSISFSPLPDPIISSDQIKMQSSVSQEVYEEALCEAVVTKEDQIESISDTMKESFVKVELNAISTNVAFQSEKLPSTSEALSMCENFPIVSEKLSSLPEAQPITIEEFSSQSNGASVSDGTKEIAITMTPTEPKLAIKDNLKSDTHDFKEAAKTIGASTEETLKEKEMHSEITLSTSGTENVKNALPSEEYAIRIAEPMPHSEIHSQLSDDIIQRAVTPIAVEKIPTIDADLTFVDVDDGNELVHEKDFVACDELIDITPQVPSTVEYFYGSLPSSVKIEPREETESFYEAPSELPSSVNEQDTEFESCISSQASNMQSDSLATELNSESMYESMTWDEESFADTTQSLKLDDDSEVLDPDQFLDPEVFHLPDSTLIKINEEMQYVAQNISEGTEREKSEFLQHKDHTERAFDKGFAKMSSDKGHSEKTLDKGHSEKSSDKGHTEKASQIQQVVDVKVEFDVKNSEQEIKSGMMTVVDTQNAAPKTELYPKLECEMVVQSSVAATVGQCINENIDTFGTTVPSLQSTILDKFSKETVHSLNIDVEKGSLQSKSTLTKESPKESIVDSQLTVQELKEVIKENSDIPTSDYKAAAQPLHGVSLKDDFDDSREINDSYMDEKKVLKHEVLEHVQTDEQYISQLCSGVISESTSEYSEPIGTQTSLDEFGTDESILFESVSSAIPIPINDSSKGCDKELFDSSEEIQSGFAMPSETQSPSDIVRYLYYDDSITFSDDHSINTCSENVSSLVSNVQLMPELHVSLGQTVQLNETSCPVKEKVEPSVYPDQMEIDNRMVLHTTNNITGKKGFESLHVETVPDSTDKSKSIDEWFDADLEKSASLGYRKQSITETKSFNSQEEDSLPRIPEIILDPEIKGIPMAKIDSDEVTDISTHFTMTDDSDRFSDIESDKSLENFDDEFATDVEVSNYPDTDDMEDKVEDNMDELIVSEKVSARSEDIGKSADEVKYQHIENTSQDPTIPIEDENGNVPVPKTDAQCLISNIPVSDTFVDVEQTPIPMDESKVFIFPEASMVNQELKDNHDEKSIVNDNSEDFLDAANENVSEIDRSIYVIPQEDVIGNDLLCTGADMLSLQENAIEFEEMMKEKPTFDVCSKNTDDKPEVFIEVTTEKNNDSSSPELSEHQTTNVTSSKACDEIKIANDDLPNLNESVSSTESGLKRSESHFVSDIIKNESDEECSSVFEMKSAASELPEITSKYETCPSEVENFYDITESEPCKILPEDAIHSQLSENTSDEIQIDVLKQTDLSNASLSAISDNLNENLLKKEHLIPIISEENLKVHGDMPTCLSVSSHTVPDISEMSHENSQLEREEFFITAETIGDLTESSVKGGLKSLDDSLTTAEINAVISENESLEPTNIKSNNDIAASSHLPNFGLDIEEPNVAEVSEAFSESTQQSIASIEKSSGVLNVSVPAIFDATSTEAFQNVSDVKLEHTSDSESLNAFGIDDASILNPLQTAEHKSFESENLKEQSALKLSKQSDESPNNALPATEIGHSANDKQEDLVPFESMNDRTFSSSPCDSEHPCSNDFQFTTSFTPDASKSSITTIAEVYAEEKLEMIAGTKNKEEDRDTTTTVASLFHSEANDKCTEPNFEKSKQTEDDENSRLHSSAGILCEEEYIDTSEGRCQEISDSNSDSSDLEQNVNFDAVPGPELVSDQNITPDTLPIPKRTLEQNVKCDVPLSAVLNSDQNVKPDVLPTSELTQDQSLKLDSLTTSEQNLDRSVKSDVPPTTDLFSGQNVKPNVLPAAELTLDQNIMLHEPTTTELSLDEGNMKEVIASLDKSEEYFESKDKMGSISKSATPDNSILNVEKTDEYFVETETICSDSTELQSNVTSFSLQHTDANINSSEQSVNTEMTFQEGALIEPDQTILYAGRTNTCEIIEKPCSDIVSSEVAAIETIFSDHSEEQTDSCIVTSNVLDVADEIQELEDRFQQELEDRESIDVKLEKSHDTYDSSKLFPIEPASESYSKEISEALEDNEVSCVKNKELLKNIINLENFPEKLDFTDESISYKTMESEIQPDVISTVDSNSTRYYSFSEGSDMTLNFTSDDDFTDVASHLTLTEDSDKWSEVGDFSLDDNEFDIECQSRDKTPTRSLAENESSELSQNNIEGSIIKFADSFKDFEIRQFSDVADGKEHAMEGISELKDLKSEASSEPSYMEKEEIYPKQDSLVGLESVVQLHESITKLEDNAETCVHTICSDEKVLPSSPEENKIKEAVHPKSAKQEEELEHLAMDLVRDVVKEQDDKCKKVFSPTPPKETLVALVSKSSDFIAESDDKVKVGGDQGLVTNHLKTEQNISFDVMEDQHLDTVDLCMEGTPNESNVRVQFESESTGTELSVMDNSEKLYLSLPDKLEEPVSCSERDISETDDFTDFSSKHLITEESEKWSDVESQAEELKSEVSESFVACNVSDSESVLSEYLSLASTDIGKTVLSAEMETISDKQEPLLECYADIKSLNEPLSIVDTFVAFDTDVAIPKLHLPEETIEHSSQIVEKSEEVDLWLEADTDYSVSEFEEDIFPAPEKDHVHVISKSSTKIDSVKDVRFATVHFPEEIPHVAEISRSSSYTDPEYSDQTSDTCADISLQGVMTENSDKSSELGNDALLDDILYGTVEELDVDPIEKEPDILGHAQRDEEKSLIENNAFDKEPVIQKESKDTDASDVNIDFHEQKLEAGGKVSINVTDVSSAQECLLVQEKADSFETSQLLTPSAATCASDDEFTNVTPLDLTEDSDKWSDISEGTSIEEMEEDSVSISLKASDQNIENLKEALNELKSELSQSDGREIKSTPDEHPSKLDSDSCTADKAISKEQSSDSSLQGKIFLKGEEDLALLEKASCEESNLKTPTEYLGFVENVPFEEISESSSKQSKISNSETDYKDVATHMGASDVSESWHDLETDQSFADLENEIVNQTQNSLKAFDDVEDISTPQNEVQSHELHDLAEESNEVIEDLDYDEEHFEENIDDYDVDIENEMGKHFLDNERYQINEDELIFPLPYDDWIEQSFELKEYGIEATGSELDIHGYGSEDYDDEDIQRAIELNISNFEENAKEAVEDNYTTESFQTLSNDHSPHTRLSGKEHDTWSTADAPSIEEDLSEHDNILAKIDELLAEDFTYGNLDEYKDEQLDDHEDKNKLLESHPANEHENLKRQQSLETTKVSKDDDRLIEEQIQSSQIQMKSNIQQENQLPEFFALQQLSKNVDNMSSETTAVCSLPAPEALNNDTSESFGVDCKKTMCLKEQTTSLDVVQDSSKPPTTAISKGELLEQDSQVFSPTVKQEMQNLSHIDENSAEKILEVVENIPLKSESFIDNFKAIVNDGKESIENSRLSLRAEDTPIVQKSNNSVDIPLEEDQVSLENANKIVEGTDVIKLSVKGISQTSLQSEEETLKLSVQKPVSSIPVTKDLAKGDPCETIKEAHSSLRSNTIKSKKLKDTSEASDSKSTTACIPPEVNVKSTCDQAVETLKIGPEQSFPQTSEQKEATTDIPLKKDKQAIEFSVTKTEKEEASELEKKISKPDIPEKKKIKTELNKSVSKPEDSDSPTSESRSDSFKSISAHDTDLKPDIPKKVRQRSLESSDKETSEQKPSLPPKKPRRRESSNTSCESLSSSVESLPSFESASSSASSKPKEPGEENIEIPDVPVRKSRSPNMSSTVRAKRDESDDSSTSSSIRLRRKDSRNPSIDLSQKRASIDERVLKLQNEGKCPNKEIAFIAAKLIEMQFEEEDALLAARQCSSVYHAVKFLTQLCELCNCRFPINQMSSMIHCAHRACKDCLKAHFTPLISDRSIFTLLCPICHKPDITDSNIQEYFNHLDMMLRNILDDRVYDLFQRKLRDEVLTKDPNFHWCSQCSSGFIASPRLKKLYCPDCSAITCALCHQTWELEHEGVHCERFQQWKDMHTPEPPPAGLVRLLTERGISCPSCGILFPQACAGCMMYKCSHCSFEFCGFCLRPCKRGRDCSNEICDSRGIHIHHQSNCLFFLRDKDISDLQMLLEEESVSYLTIPPKDQIVKSRCQVREQKHIHGAISEDRCGRDIEPYCAGLCRTHYLEYLAELMRKHKVDPLSIMTIQDLQFMLRKARITVPEKVKGETEDDYYDRLVKYVSLNLV